VPWRRCIVALFAALGLGAAEARAWDFVAKLGMIRSDVTPRDSGGTVSIDGVAASVGLREDIYPQLAFEATLQPLVNLQTREISRNAVSAALEWSVLGQGRRYASSSDLGAVSYYGGSSLYLIGKAGLQYYQLYVGPSVSSVKGSTLGVMGGAGYRYDFGTRQAVGAQLLTTLVSFANSSEGLEVREYEAAVLYILQLP
jgi:hypothetical protein